MTLVLVVATGSMALLPLPCATALFTVAARSSDGFWPLKPWGRIMHRS